jgi:hypothetical protein
VTLAPLLDAPPIIRFGDDLDFHPGACGHRLVHAGARPNHEQGGIRRMTETVSRAAQGGLVALSLERLDDGRPLILADEANDKLGGGS